LSLLQAELARLRTPRAFSPEGLAQLLDRQTEYLTELALEAIRVARRARNDEVQATNVDEAERRVRSEQSAPRELALAFGGLVGGGSLSLLVAEITIDDPSLALTVVSVVVLVITVGLLLWSILGRRTR
jgi:hypothetical protein